MNRRRSVITAIAALVALTFPHATQAAELVIPGSGGPEFVGSMSISRCSGPPDPR